jgi:predicted nucleic acid-binding protein
MEEIPGRRQTVTIVIDSSITLGWVYEDEKSSGTSHVLDLVMQTGAWVPAMWHLEVANGLQGGIRRRRIDRRFRDGALADLAKLNIKIDGETGVIAWSDTLKLADHFRLTLYDTCYLELAHRRDLPLATLDRELRTAGRKLGIELLGA